MFMGESLGGFNHVGGQRAFPHSMQYTSLSMHMSMDTLSESPTLP